ncbi:allantoinase AllB [Lutispora saccharofermentans]|uniref:allantoinase n=1 Tax=Lutispora saccharofermentans TaxID=3024236 RepID=A0ABT1NC65_9FIRM|nr:allantoinase AllB [Lutispora saccharofermentans]MCQ1528854.1 allantoinase AllB [Lutispora saccharofermentans]
MVDLVIKNAHVVTPANIFLGGVAIENGKIAAVASDGSLPEAKEVIDGKGNYLIPGGVDPHVHIRFPGGAHRENFKTGTEAAAAGGITTIIEHPISNPPQYSVEILNRRVEAVKEQAIVDVAFLGAAGGGHLDKIGEIGKAGIVGYKTFLHDAPEGRTSEFEGLTSKNNFELNEVLKEIKKTSLLASAHAEDNDLVSGGIAKLRKEGKTYPKAHCESRPAIVEVLAVERLIRLAKENGTRLYLVHMSTPEAVELAKRARQEGQEIYIETCPHYLYLADDALDKFGTYAKCNPALRDKDRVAKMWDYIKDGTIDTIGSDHAPYTVEEKEKKKEDIFVAPSGFPGIETSMPLMFTAAKENKISIDRAVKLLSTNPSKIFGLYPKKGAICPGADADLVLIDPDEGYTIHAGEMFTKARDVAKVFEGKRVYGKIKKTILRGKVVFDEGKILAKPGYGQWVVPVK